MHASTFSGNALTMAAGKAAMNNFQQATLKRINQLGERLRTGFNEVFALAGVKAMAIGHGSLSNVHFTDKAPRNVRDSIQAMIDAGHVGALLHLGMLRHGVASASRLMYCISTPMTTPEVDTAIAAMGQAIDELKPYIEKERPNLLV